MVDTSKPLMGVAISGSIYREDEQELDTDEFTDAFIEFVESKKWCFGGATRPVDLNEDDDGDDYTPSGRPKINHRNTDDLFEMVATDREAARLRGDYSKSRHSHPDSVSCADAGLAGHPAWADAPLMTHYIGDDCQPSHAPIQPMEEVTDEEWAAMEEALDIKGEEHE